MDRRINMRQTDRQLKLLEGLTNKQFRTKYKVKSLKRPKRSKKQRQAWWKGLSSKQQDKYIETVQKRKAAKNRIKQRIVASKAKNCLTCSHYKGKHCDGVSKDYCCRYYFNAMDPKEWVA